MISPFERHSRVVLSLGPDQVVAMEVSPSGNVSELGVAHVDVTSSDPVKSYYEAAVSALGHIPARHIAIGLPNDWLSRATLAVPPLRGLDRIGYLLRELARTSDHDANDILFAEDPNLNSKRGTMTSDSHLVIAAAETQTLGLVEALRKSHVQTDLVTCATTAAMLHFMESDQENDDATQHESVATVFLKKDSFAIAIRSGAALHQIRIVTVPPPEPTESLAQALLEEIRRSSIFYREKSRGGTLSRLMIIGRFLGDHQQLEEILSNGSDIETVVDSRCGPGGEFVAEALALTSTTRRYRPINLLPVEFRKATTRRILAAASIFVALTAVAGSLYASRQLRGQSKASTFLLSEVSSNHERIIQKRRDYDDIVARLRSFAGQKSTLTLLYSSRVGLERLLDDIAGSVNDVVRVVSVNITSPLNADAQLTIRGAIYTDEWDYDSRLHSFTTQLAKATGSRVEIVIGDTFKVDNARPFTVRLVAVDPGSET